MTSGEPTPTTQRPDKPDDAALFDAIAAEHATIYGYGFVSAHSTPDENWLVSTAMREHRARREAAIAMLAARSVTHPVAAVGYQLPITVETPSDAVTLAIRMETDDAVAWRAVVEQATTDQDREFGVTALRECAIMAARWRQVLEEWPLTVPFPGGSE